MKKSLILLTAITALSFALTPCLPLQSASAVTDDYSVAGGRCVVEFEDSKDEALFDLYTELDKAPWLMEGNLVAWTLAEQNIIFKDKTYTDVEVSVDISTVNENGKFDSGIYVAAKDAIDRMDGITAWEVNIEHGAGNPTFDLKLHRFENRIWKGAVVEIFALPYAGDTMNLRVVVKGGTLYAFLNGSKAPAITYNIGNEGGMVGMRNFYSPNTFDNFSVTGEGNAVDVSLLEHYAKLAREEIKKPLVEECLNELNTALALGREAKTQEETDQAAQALKTALERAVEKHTQEELSMLVERADSLENPQGKVYTVNSWNSLLAVKEICAALTSESGEYDISYWYGRLDARINGLVSYMSEVKE